MGRLSLRGPAWTAQIPWQEGGGRTSRGELSKQMGWGVWEGWIPPSLSYVVALAG